MRSCVFTLAAVAVCLALGRVATAALPAVSFPIPKELHSGSGYTAIQVGPDGKVYVGTAWYGGSAHLVRLDPATGKWEDLIDAQRITRDTGTGLDSQSKFHAKILVGADGLIWSATKRGNEEFENRPEYGENATGFAGGHLFSYNPKTGQVVDHGIMKPQEGLMGGAIDHQRQRLYYVSDPKGHFLIYDIAKGTVRDLGRSGPTPRYMAIDAKGRVFCAAAPLPGDTAPCMTMYDPATDRLSQLTLTIEGGEAKDYKTPYVLVASADGRKLFGAGMGGNFVMEYDLATITTKTANPYANGAMTCRLVGGVPGGDEHAGTLGQDGAFYFNSGDKLIRYDPKARRVEVLGVIETPGAWQGVHSQGASIGPDGTLYMKFIYPYQVLAFDKLTAPQGGK